MQKDKIISNRALAEVKSLFITDFFEQDIWYPSDLGLEVPKYKLDNSYISFKSISQTWLKKVIKQYIFLRAANHKITTLFSDIFTLTRFSVFLKENYPSLQFKEIERNVILEFFVYLNLKKYSKATQQSTIYSLNYFFNEVQDNQWAELKDRLLIKKDLPGRVKAIPRYIPEEVMRQLNQHLGKLPEPVMRMVLVIQECGLRISELLQLPINCLKKGNNSTWFLQFMRWKMNKEDIIPISSELAEVIQEQQQYIRKLFGLEFDYLFCTCFYYGRCEPKIMQYWHFKGYLEKLAIEFNICDNTGKIWKFQSHQFRHTVGTRMINSGVPQYIVQRYLGHESPEMTMVYAHIHDKTLQKEIQKYHESRVVNFQGEALELEQTILSSNNDLEWFKRNVQARALEHGYCARPTVLGECDIPGFDGCYNCAQWRTNKNFLPILKDTLERTNKVIEKARNCGWELQVKKNEPIQHNLEKVIASLDE